MQKPFAKLKTTNNVLLRSISAICLAFLCITTHAIPDSCANFCNSNGAVTQNLSDLLTTAQAQYYKSKDISTIQKSADITEWRTHPKTERWNFMLPTKFKKHTNAIIDICENKLGMKKRILPNKKINYSGVLFLGASLNNVVDRTRFYNEMVAKGKIDKKLKVWVLTGERKLNKQIGETKQNFLKLVPTGEKPLPLPTNEMEMIKFVFHYMVPKETKVEYIYSPKDPNCTRATTASTTVAWANKIPRPSHQDYYLGISNQPYVAYQELVTNRVLHTLSRKNIRVSVIGDEALPHKNRENYASVLLDTVAKIIAYCQE